MLAFLPLAGTSAQADELAISCDRHWYYLFEPVVIDVALKLNSPPDLDVINAASPQHRQVRSRLKAELHSREGKIAEAFLGGGAFELTPESSTESRATLLGFLGNKHFAGNEVTFSLWDQTGQFRLLVRDTDSGVTSNMTALEIRPSPDVTAAQLFASKGTATIALLLDREHGDEAFGTFETLASKYADTIYGVYAAASLSLRRIDRMDHRRQEPSSEELRRLADELETCAGKLPAGHPLWNRTVLALSSLPNCALTLDSRQELLTRLQTHCRDSAFSLEAKRRLDALNANRDAPGE